jgi:hypothetical protein
MIAAAAASYKLTPKPVHEANAFSFGPIKEVGFLFVGIFLTMMPALGYIAEHGREFGVEKPMQYYTASGSLSSVLDNAPTYATFFELAQVSAREKQPEAFPVESAPQIESTRASAVGPRTGRRGEPRRGVFRRDDLHRQRSELHGEGHRRRIRGKNTEFLRLHPSFFAAYPSADPPACRVDIPVKDWRSREDGKSGLPER